MTGEREWEAGEDFVLIDKRNPQAWSQSSLKVPEAIRVPCGQARRKSLQGSEGQAHRHVLHLTERAL